jgi:hypothetical protein
MNHLSYKRKLQKQLLEYAAYLPYCNTDKERFKLLDEIMILKFQILKIEQKSLEEAEKEVWFITETFKSTMNYEKALER